MADIFISYSSADRDRARMFAAAFEGEGFSVWWDAGLHAGESFDFAIEQAIREAKAVVVLWSRNSVQSRWVRAEATLADRLRTLIPCMIEPCDRPIMFELTHTVDLGHWRGETGDRAWRGFLMDVGRLVGGERPTEASAPAAPPSPKPTAGAPRESQSIAILPFTNRSADPADEAFAEGMAEDVAAALSQACDLRVISHRATQAYRGDLSDVRGIGRALSARYLLEGNVRRVGQNLRVTAQLVEAETGAILWTRKFDRPLAELAELQEDLVTEVVAHLGTQVRKAEMQRALRKPGDITAWEAVMRAWAALARYTPENIATAVMEARRAVQLAPDYALGHSTLGMTLATQFQAGGFRDIALLGEAATHADAALALDTTDAMVLQDVALIFSLAQRWKEALALAERAVSLSPFNANARHVLGRCLVRFNRCEEALVHLAEADRGAPSPELQLYIHLHRAAALAGLGRFEESLESADAAMLLDPIGIYTLYSRAALLQVLGREDEARAVVRQMRAHYPDAPLEFWLGLARASAITEATVNLLEAHLTAAWNATPAEG